MGLKKRIRVVALVAGLAVTPPILYILSAGPIIFIGERFGFPVSMMAVVERVYQPLGGLFESKSVGGRAFRAYLRLWLKEEIPEEITVPSGL